MSKLNSQQAKILKTIESKEDRKALKKLFKKENKAKKHLDSKKILKKLFKKLNHSK